MKTAIFVAAVSWLAAGCSLVKLSEDIVQEGCTSDADCAVLDSEAALDRDPCQRWACDAEQKRCVYGPLDEDHDGQSPGTCAGDDDTRDCDDGEAHVGAGFEERCDMLDNDCDELTDEGALQSATEPLVVLPAGASAADAAYALDPMTREVALAYGLLDGANVRPAMSAVPDSLRQSGDVTTLDVQGLSSPQVEQVALATLASGRFAYGLVNRSTTGRQLHVGTVRAGQPGSEALAAPDAMVSTCLAGGCADVAELAVAGQGSHVLAAYLRYADDPASAACGAVGATVELNAGMLLQPSATTALEARASDVVIDDASDLTAPSVVAVPAPPGGGGDERGFLVGYVDGGGDVVVRHVLRNGNAAEPGEERLRIAAGGDARSSVALALAVADDDAVLLGVAHQRGCSVESVLVVGLYELDDDLALSPLAEGLLVGNGIAQSSPALAYSPARDTWAVVYRDRDGLRARIAARDGRLHGREPYTLIENRGAPDDADAQSVVLTPAALARGTDFGAVAHVSHGDGEPRTFEGVRLGCD